MKHDAKIANDIKELTYVVVPLYNDEMCRPMYSTHLINHSTLLTLQNILRCSKIDFAIGCEDGI